MTVSKHFTKAVRRTRSSGANGGISNANTTTTITTTTATTTTSTSSTTADIGTGIKRELAATSIASTFESDISQFDSKAPKIRKLNHVKLEYESTGSGNITGPPEHFWPMYREIRKMRQIIKTPVDAFGCAKIPVILQTITENFHSTGEITKLTPEQIKQLEANCEPGEAINEFKPDRVTTKEFRFQLFVSLMFSSQTKDEVNFQVMQSLHCKYLLNYPQGLCCEAIHQEPADSLNKLINSIGFHTRKTQYLKLASERIINEFNGDIPNTLQDLMSFKGIGFKMGILIMMGAWGLIEGISVDTHMARMAGLYNWIPMKSSKSDKMDPEYVRKCFEEMLANDKEIWSEINPVLVGFGQSVCTPVGRRCDLCWLRSEEFNDSKIQCPSVDKRLLIRVKRGTDSERKIRGDLDALIKMAPKVDKSKIKQEQEEFDLY